MNYEQLIAAGFTPEEARAYLAKNPPPAAAPADATGVRIPREVVGAAGITALLGGTVVGGRAALRGAAGVSANRRLRRAVNEADGGVQGLIRRIQEFNATGRGENLTLSDLDPRLAAEADFVATNNPQARVQLGSLHAERRRGMPERMIGDVERIAPASDLRTPPGSVQRPGGYADAPGIAQQLQQEQQAFARSPEGYEGLRANNATINPEGAGRLAQFLDNPRLARAWQDAASVGAVGPLPKADALSFEVLQGFKERLEGMKERAYRQGDGDLGRRLGAAYDELDTILDESIPGYAEVNARYRQFSDQRRALEMGQELWRDRTMQLPELERRIAALQPAERELVQKGMLGAYIADVENARKNSGFLEEMRTRLPVQQRKIELMFGGKEGFARALQTFEQEIAMARLGEVVGGSQTARRAGQQTATTAETIGDAAHVIGSPVTGIPTVAQKGVAQWMPGAVAERMAPRVTARGAPALEDLLRTLMKLR